MDCADHPAGPSSERDDSDDPPRPRVLAPHTRVLQTSVRQGRDTPLCRLPRLRVSGGRDEDGGVLLERNRDGVMEGAGPIRILRVIPRYAPAWRYGGSVKFSYDLDAALVERGFRVTVYTTDQIDQRNRSPVTHECLHGIDIHRFPNPWNYLASQAAWVGLYPRGMKRALHNTVADFDLVHVTEARGAHARWAFDTARQNGVPVAWSPLGGLAPGVGIRKPYRRGYDVVHHT